MQYISPLPYVLDFCLDCISPYNGTKWIGIVGLNSDS